MLLSLRRSEERLSLDLNEAGNKLSLFSETFLETFGIAPSYCASLPGSHQHLTFLESEEGLAGFLLVWRRGETGNETSNCQKSLTLLREDQSFDHFDHFDHFDLFNPKFNVFNMLIWNKRKGKSIL